MTMPAARSLRDVRMADAAEVGGKAASLGELMATAVRVPEGVVLTVEGVDLPPDERNRQIASAAESLGDGPLYHRPVARPRSLMLSSTRSTPPWR